MNEYLTVDQLNSNVQGLIALLVQKRVITYTELFKYAQRSLSEMDQVGAYNRDALQSITKLQPASFKYEGTVAEVGVSLDDREVFEKAATDYVFTLMRANAINTDLVKPLGVSINEELGTFVLLLEEKSA